MGPCTAYEYLANGARRAVYSYHFPAASLAWQGPPIGWLL
jgi:hypothetical protein